VVPADAGAVVIAGSVRTTDGADDAVDADDTDCAVDTPVVAPVGSVTTDSTTDDTTGIKTIVDSVGVGPSGSSDGALVIAHHAMAATAASTATNPMVRAVSRLRFGLGGLGGRLTKGSAAAIGVGT
jgi:hypothetical protein